MNSFPGYSFTNKRKRESLYYNTSLKLVIFEPNSKNPAANLILYCMIFAAYPLLPYQHLSVKRHIKLCPHHTSYQVRTLQGKRFEMQC